MFNVRESRKMNKKNQLILLSLLGAMATPLAIQPLQASFAEKLSQQAVEKEKKAAELAAQKAASEAQAAKQKEVAVQNEDVKKELNDLIDDINSNLGSGLKVVATADKDGLKAGVQEIDKALKTALAEKKAFEAELAKLKTDVETLLTSIRVKSGKAALKNPVDASPAAIAVAIKDADTDVQGIVLGGPAVNLAPLQADIDALIVSLTAKTGAVLAASADDTPAEMIKAVKAADAVVNNLASPAELRTLRADINNLLVPINAKSGNPAIANAANSKPATLSATVKLAITEATAIPVGGGGGLPAGFVADVGKANAVFATILGAKHTPTMDFKTTGADLEASAKEIEKVLGTLPANFQTIVKPDGGAPTTILGFYGVVEDMVDTIATGKGALGARLGGSAATPASGLGKLKIAMDLHKVKL
jgi:hypothetical protein